MSQIRSTATGTPPHPYPPGWRQSRRRRGPHRRRHIDDPTTRTPGAAAQNSARVPPSTATDRLETTVHIGFGR